MIRSRHIAIRAVLWLILAVALAAAGFSFGVAWSKAAPPTIQEVDRALSQFDDDIVVRERVRRVALDWHANSPDRTTVVGGWKVRLKSDRVSSPYSRSIVKGTVLMRDREVEVELEVVPDSAIARVRSWLGE